MRNLIFSLILIFSLSVGVQNTWAQIITPEEFNYNTGDTLGSYAWISFSGGPINPIAVTLSGLSYTNYASSNIGKAAQLKANGSDYYKATTLVTSGSVYASFMVNVSAAKSGDYFFALGQSTSTNIFQPRIYVKDSSGSLSFGISKGPNALYPSYGPNGFFYDTTYLVVAKYQFNAGSNTDDSLWLFVFTDPDLPESEPTNAYIGPYSSGTTDLVNVGRVFLRQGTATVAPTLVIDGIRIAKNWSDIPLPISLNSFTSSVVGNNVTLNWTTATETNNSHFEIERQSGSVWQKIGSITGSGTTNTEKHYSYIDQNLNPGNYSYRLKQLDYNGNFEYYNLSSSVIVGVPKTFSVISYPNPFNPIATIKYNLPQDADVQITIFNTLGQRITTLVNEKKSAGFYSVQFDGSSLSSGLYFYKITAGNYSAVKKIVLIK